MKKDKGQNKSKKQKIKKCIKKKTKRKLISDSDSGSDCDDTSLNMNFGKGIPKLQVTSALRGPRREPPCIDRRVMGDRRAGEVKKNTYFKNLSKTIRYVFL